MAAPLPSERVCAASSPPFSKTMSTMPHPANIAGAVLRIDLEALIANYRAVEQRAGTAQVAAVVKADAYGLGARTVAPALEQAGCREFFVAHLSEAMELQGALTPQSAIYILNGLPADCEELAHGIGAIPVLNALEQVDRWNALGERLGTRLPAALQFDTGMARLGLSECDVAELIAAPSRMDAIDLRLLMSHLACADNPHSEVNEAQAALFRRHADHFPDVRRSLDNSGGACLDRDHFHLVRAGISLYGGACQDEAPVAMRPVISLEAAIVQVRDVPAGAGIGYGLTCVSDRPRRIATISVGYADGWPRCLGNRGSAFISGQRVPIAGRVSMDSITLDVTDVSRERAGPGCLVELLGHNQSLDDVAADAGTIAYEILTQLGRRYARTYAGGMADQATATFCQECLA